MDYQEHHEGENLPQHFEQSLYPQTPTEEASSDIQLILARLGLLETPTLIGASVAQLINALQDERWETRASAATALGDKETSVPIDPLITALKDIHKISTCCCRTRSRKLEKRRTYHRTHYGIS